MSKHESVYTSVIARYPEYFSKWFTQRTRCLVDRKRARWSDVEADIAKALLSNDISIEVVAKSLGRSLQSIRAQVSDGFTDIAVYSNAFEDFWNQVVEYFLPESSTESKDHPIMRTPPLFTRYFTLYLGCAEDDLEGWVKIEDDTGPVKEKVIKVSESIWGSQQGAYELDEEIWNWRRFKVHQVQTLELPVKRKAFEDTIGNAIAAGMSYLETGLLLMLKGSTIHNDLARGVISSVTINSPEETIEEKGQEAMKREDILARLKAKVEGLYKARTGVDMVEVINFELREDSALRIYVKVGFIGAPTILHGRINDARDFGVFLTQDEIDFLDETDSQAPARIAPRTRVSQYVMHLVSQLRHIVGDGSELHSLTGALLNNPNLTNLMHSERFEPDEGVDSIVTYVERMLTDLACDHRSGAAVLWVQSLLSNPSLISIIKHQQYLDEGP